MPWRQFLAEPYLLAVAATGIGLLVRVPVWSLLHGEAPYITLYPAVAITAIRGGFYPGIAATLLSCLAATYFFIPPVFDLRVVSAADHLATLYFAIFGVLISHVAQKARNARRQAEMQRMLTHQTLASIGYGVIATDRKGRVTFMNSVAERLTGWPSQEAMGREIQEVFRKSREETGSPVANPLDRVLREGCTVGPEDHMVITSREGTVTPVGDSGAPIRDSNGSIIGGVLVFRDLSERRAAEQRALWTERRLSQLADANIFGILFADVHGNIREANDEFLRMIGRSREELRQGKLRWIDLTPPEYMPAHMRAIEEARERGACTPFEKEYIRPDGSRVSALMGFILLEPDRVESVAFVADLTERKQAERALRQINEDLQHFTWGAGHDLKEPLRMVGSYAQLLSRRYRNQLGPDADEFLRYINEGVERMKALVDALLEYSRAGEVTKAVRPVCAEEALQNSLTSLQTAVQESGAEVTWSSLPSVLVDELHLTQLFQNLIGNAIKYRGTEPPRITICAKAIDNMYQFTVRDNGLGIEPEYQERVFGVFQRLHGRELSGTGLGLATCRRIVERHGGRIWVESEGEGRGCAFHFTLPAGVNHEPASV